MDPDSAEAYGLAAYAAVANLLAHLEKTNPGTVNTVIGNAIAGLENTPGPNTDAMIQNLRKLMT